MLRLLRGTTAPLEPIEKRRPDEIKASIEQLAASLEPAFAEAILSYLTALRDTATLEAILAALEAGSMTAVLELLASIDTTAAAIAVEDRVRETLWAGGLLAATQIRYRPTAVTFMFDRLNPQLISYLRSYSLGLIKQVDDQAKAAVRDALLQGMAKGEGPAVVARQVKQSIGLLPKQAQAVSNFRKELEAWHTRKSAKGWGLGSQIDQVNGHTVFKPDEDGNPKDGILERRLRDRRFDKTLMKTLGSGKPLTPEQIDKMVAAYEKRWLAYRARMIARTESLRTVVQGVQASWQQAIDKGVVPVELVRRQWIITKDERTCPVCGPIPAMNGKRGVKMDQPFATPGGPVMMPPLHPHCRCTIWIQVFEAIQLMDEAA